MQILQYRPIAVPHYGPSDSAWENLKLFNRYGDRSRLRRRDFGFVVRAFTENGCKPMTEDEVTTLWRLQRWR